MARQRGQVMVITALMMTAMIGALGLAIDGGRIYVDRRVMQNAVDATALGAADTYGLSFRGGVEVGCPSGATSSAALTNAYTVGLTEFANQVGAPTSRFSQSGSDPVTTYTDATDGYSYTISRLVPTASVDPAACAFKVTATHNLGMAFIQVLNGVGTQSIGTAAQAISAQNLVVPGALMFLLDPSNVAAAGQQFCGTGMPNDTLSPAGSGSLTVAGSVVTDGNINMWTSNSFALIMQNGGGLFDHCDAALSAKPANNDPYPACAAPPGGICWGNDGVQKFHGHVLYLYDPFGPNNLDWCGTDSLCAGVNQGTSSLWLPAMDKAPYTTASPTNVAAGSGTPAELEPGLYTSDPGFTSMGGTHGCWFVEPGIYQWQAGLRSTSGSALLSNELMPPSGVSGTGPAIGNSQNFSWHDGGTPGSGAGSAGCVGSVVGHASACLSGCAGAAATTYSFRVASVRAEAAPPGGTTACSSQPTVLGAGGTAVNACWRQSYLSQSCVTLTNILPLSTLQIGISNVPGMGNSTQLQSGNSHDRLLDSRYDIFASKAGCADSAPWGYVTSAFFNCSSGGNTIEPNSTIAPASCSGMNTGTQTPKCSATSTLSFTTANHFESDGSCGLGYVISTTINSSDLPASFAPSGSACPIGTAPGPGSACAPWYTSSTLCTNSTSCDAANDDYCLSHSGGGAFCKLLVPSATGGDVTPGGALFVTPPSAGPPPNGANCFVMTNGGAQYFVFGTSELWDIAYYAPDNCPVTIDGGNGGAFVGWGYMPGSSNRPVLGGNGNPFDGGVDLWTLTIKGGANVDLSGDVPAFPVVFPLSARLLTCTNTDPGCPAP